MNDQYALGLHFTVLILSGMIWMWFCFVRTWVLIQVSIQFQYTFDTLCDTAPLQRGPKSYPIVSKSYSWQPKFEVLVFGVPKNTTLIRIGYDLDTIWIRFGYDLDTMRIRFGYDLDTTRVRVAARIWIFSYRKCSKVYRDCIWGPRFVLPCEPIPVSRVYQICMCIPESYRNPYQNHKRK